MRKTSISLFVLLLLTLCFASLFTFESSKAQNSSAEPNQVAPPQDDLKQIPKMIRNAKGAQAVFVRRELFRTQTRLFQSDNPSVANEPQLGSVVNDGVVFELDKPAAAKLVNDNVEYLALSLPDSTGSTVDLELIKVDIFAPGFSVKTAAPTNESLKDAPGVHYRGIVNGDERSLAAISIFKNQVIGFFSTEAAGNSVVGRLEGDNPSDTHIVYAERDLKVTREFTCETKDPQSSPFPASDLETPQELPGQCIRIYVEADFDLFQNKGSVTNTANYLTALFNQSATLFANDGIPVTLSEILVWNVSSPYTGINTTSALLDKFGDVRTSFNGDFAHLVALRGNGGIAWVDTFCNSASLRQAFSGIDASFQNVPTYSWSVEVFTHELGHSMGSRHTHACVWNGNGTAIDGCGPAAGVSEGTCSAGPIPSNGGTIMSYCHLTSVGINFTFGFGTQPRNVILNRRDTANCLTCNTQTPPNDNFANAQVISNFSGEAPGSNAGATKETGEPNHHGNAGGKSVWYRWQAPGTGTVTITTGSNYDSLLGVYTGSSVGSLTFVASNDDDPNGGLSSRVSFTANSGTTYQIAVDGFNGASGSINLNWSLVAPPNAPGAQPATNLASTSFTANWNSSTGATGYRLDVSTSSTFSSFVSGFQNLDVGNVLSRSVTGLSPSTNYFYRVRAYNAHGTSGNSGTIPVTTTSPSVQVTVQTNPSGRSFTVDGTTFTSAQTFNWSPGSSHTISTTSPQNGSAGTRFSFANWSDGGAISHSVSPTSNTTFTANFTTQHFLTMNAGTGGTVNPPSGWFNSGQVVSISATPASGFSFNGWTGSGSGSFTGLTNPASVTMNGPITENASFGSGPQAAYDATLKAPKCGQPGSSCDSGLLLNGRDTMSSGNEPNQPNTINNSCPDGNAGNYHTDESIDKVKISTLDGSNFAPGKTARIDVTAWAWLDPARDRLDLYYAADATNPSWVFITTLQPTVAGNQVLSATYTLPSGGNLQAVRARLRFEGTASPCTGLSSFDDHDDLIFTTSSAAPVNVALPVHGSVASASSTLASNYLPGNVINGERAGANSTTGGVFNGWISNQSMPQWLQIDFGQVRSIHQIDVLMVQDNYQNPSPPTLTMTFTQYGLHAFEVQYWNGSSWLTIPGGSVTGNNKVWKQFSFAAISTSRIRVLTNASPDNFSRLTEVEAWSNTAVPPPPPTAVNVALPVHGSVASASSTLVSNYVPGNVINGERAGANSTTGGVFNGWISNQSMPQWLQVDFGQARSIHQIDVFMVQDNYQNPSPPTLTMTFTQFGLHGFEVQYWNGSSWVTVPGGSVTGNNKVWKQFTFAAISTSRIRVLTNASPDNFSRLTEVEAWSNTAPPPLVNVASAANGGVASASSTLVSNYVPGNVINGERAGANSTTGGVFNGWISNQSMPQWLQVDFSQARSIHQIDVFMVQDNYQNPSPPTLDMTFTQFGLHGFEVQYWNGSSWVTVPGGSVSGNNKVWKQFTFAAVSTSRIRVLTNASPDNFSRLTEVEAWSNP